jgi:hypothetical protein
LVGPNRGGVFWLEMEAEGRHPVCVLTRDEAIPTALLKNLARLVHSGALLVVGVWVHAGR